MAPSRPSLQACARKLRTVASDVLAVAQAADLLLEQALQPLLALDQRQLGRALAIQEQKIEGEEHELICPAFIHRRLQPAEDRHAVGVERAQLAVEIGRLHLQRAQAPRSCGGIDATSPGQSGQQLDVAAVDARVHAVAVVLDLVHPAIARRRLVYQARAAAA